MRGKRSELRSSAGSSEPLVLACRSKVSGGFFGGGGGGGGFIRVLIIWFVCVRDRKRSKFKPSSACRELSIHSAITQP
jgi:hypothetical protein